MGYESSQAVFGGRVLPQNLEAERAVLGACLLSEDATNAVYCMLSPDDFCHKGNQLIYDQICSLRNSGLPCDAVTLCDALKDSGNLECVGGVSYVSGLLDSVPAPASAPYYANIVKEKARIRALITAASQLIADGFEGCSSAAELQSKAEKDLMELSRDTSGEEKQPEKVARAAISNMLDDDRDRRIYTGITPIDCIVQGLRKGNVSVLGAEPSTGKTALALNIAYHAIKNKKKVVYFSLEMSSTQLLDRIIANDVDISYESISGKSLNKQEKDWYQRTALAIAKDKLLYLYDTCYLIEDMLGLILKIKPDLVIVDFLQFCRTASKTSNTADRLEYIVSEFKRIAKLPYCSCHIMLLSQPSRGSGLEKQSMFTLKGSSAIEQGGDVILLLDRPAVRDPKYPNEQANVRIAKNKFGPTGSVDLYFDGQRQRFREMKPGDMFTRNDVDEVKPW